MHVSEVLWDQMSRKKEGMSPRIISHPSHLPESHFFESHNSFMYGFLNFRFFGFCPVFPVLWTPPDPPTFFVGRSRGLHEFSWKIHGFPWVSMGPHGVPWGPMGSHGVPMASMENPRMSEIVDFNENHYSVRQK